MFYIQAIQKKWDKFYKKQKPKAHMFHIINMIKYGLMIIKLIKIIIHKIKWIIMILIKMIQNINFLKKIEMQKQMDSTKHNYLLLLKIMNI